MTKIGVYVSNMTDKLVTPGKYVSAAECHAQRLAAVRGRACGGAERGAEGPVPCASVRPVLSSAHLQEHT